MDLHRDLHFLHVSTIWIYRFLGHNQLNTSGAVKGSNMLLVKNSHMVFTIILYFIYRKIRVHPSKYLVGGIFPPILYLMCFPLKA